MMKRSAKGFTLAELLLAAAIISFVLASLLMFFSSCVLLNESNRNLTLAVTHNNYIMEGIRHLDFANVAVQINNGLWNLNSAQINSAGLTALTGESIVSQVSGADPLTVTVTVNWQDRNLRPRSISFQTMIGSI